MFPATFNTIEQLFLAIVIIQLTPQQTSSAGLRDVVEILHNFESIDPQVINLLDDRVGSYKNTDTSQVDLSEVNTNDILNCFNTLTYTCFQKKILVYMDALNKIDKINVFGGYVSFIRVSKDDNPPLTEQYLASRRINDEYTLAGMLRNVFDNFIDNHIFRIRIPLLNAHFDTRSFHSNPATCYDFAISDKTFSLEAKNNARNKSASEDVECHRRHHGDMTLSSMVLMKLLSILPTLMKIIAVKATFALIIGLTSIIIVKIAILPPIFAYFRPYFKHYDRDYGSYRAGIGTGTVTGLETYTLRTSGAAYDSYFPTHEPTAIGAENQSYYGDEPRYDEDYYGTTTWANDISPTMLAESHLETPETFHKPFQSPESNFETPKTFHKPFQSPESHLETPEMFHEPFRSPESNLETPKTFHKPFQNGDYQSDELYSREESTADPRNIEKLIISRESRFLDDEGRDLSTKRLTYRKPFPKTVQNGTSSKMMNQKLFQNGNNQSNVLLLKEELASDPNFEKLFDSRKWNFSEDGTRNSSTRNDHQYYDKGSDLNLSTRNDHQYYEKGSDFNLSTRNEYQYYEKGSDLNLSTRNDHQYYEKGSDLNLSTRNDHQYYNNGFDLNLSTRNDHQNFEKRSDLNLSNLTGTVDSNDFKKFINFNASTLENHEIENDVITKNFKNETDVDSKRNCLNSLEEGKINENKKSALESKKLLSDIPSQVDGSLRFENLFYKSNPQVSSHYLRKDVLKNFINESESLQLKQKNVSAMRMDIDTTNETPKTNKPKFSIPSTTAMHSNLFFKLTSDLPLPEFRDSGNSRQMIEPNSSSGSLNNNKSLSIEESRKSHTEPYRYHQIPKYVISDSESTTTMSITSDYFNQNVK